MSTVSNSDLNWFQPIGKTAHCKVELKDDELRIYTGQRTEKSYKITGILRIRRDRRYRDLFSLHATLWHAGGRDDIERNAQARDLRMMFDIPRDVEECNQVALAAHFGASHFVSGLFIREGHEISFPGPGRTFSREPFFCFELDKDGYMTKIVDRLIKTGKIR